MNGIEIESVELDEQLWRKWVQKGKLQDQAQSRRWRVIGGVFATLLFVASAVYTSLALR